MPLYRVEVGIEASCVAYVLAPTPEAAEKRIAEVSVSDLVVLPESMVMREPEPAQPVGLADLEIDAGWKHERPFVVGKLLRVFYEGATCFQLLTDVNCHHAPVKEG